MSPRLGKFLKVAKRTLLGLGIFCVLAVLVAELTVNFLGYPQWVRRRVENAILPSEKGLCIIGWLKGGPFTGFEAEDIIVDVHTPVGLVHVEVPSLEIKLSVPALLALDVRPSRIVVRDTKASLNLNRHDALALNFLNAQLRLNSHDTLQAAIDTQAAGINFRLNATLYNGARLPEMLLAPSQASPEEQEAQLERARTILREVHYELARLSFGTNDTFVQANFRGDFLDLEKTSLQGEYSMNDALFHDIVVPKQRGVFRYANHSVFLDDLQMLFSANEVIRGSAEYHLRTDRLTAQLNGRIFPDTIVRLADCAPGTIPEWLRFITPIEFDATLTHLGDDWNDLQPAIRFDCGELQVAGLPVRKCAGRLGLRDQIVTLEDATAELDYRQRETLHGNASWNLRTNELSAHLDGTVSFPRIAQSLGYDLYSSTPLAAVSPTTFDLALQPSPLDWTKWRLDGRVSQPHWRLDTIGFANTEAQFSLDNGELNLARLETHPMLAQETSVTATLKCELPRLLAGRRKAPIDLHAWLRTKTKADDRPEAVLEAAGTIYADLRRYTLSLENGHGGVYPQTVCDLLESLLQIDPAYQLDWLHSERPGTIDFNIPQWSLQDWEGFQLHGQANFADCRLQKMPLSQLDAEFVVTPRDFQMRHIAFDSPAHNPQAEGAFTIEFVPFAIQFDHLDYRGDPLHIEPLLVAPDVIALYHQIWEPLSWHPATPPHFQLGLIEYRNLPAQRSWMLNIQGTADAADFRYRKLEVPQAHCRLDLALPEGGLHILDVVLDSQEPDDPTRFTGEAHLKFNNDITGRFDLHFHEGELDLLDLLRNVAEPLVPILEPFEFSHQTYFDAHGDFVLGANPYLRLTGSVESPFLRFKALKLENIEAKWLATPQFIHWDCGHAEFFGGKFAATGEYNHAGGTGQCLANIKNIPLAELIRVTASTFREHGAEAADPEPKASAIQPGLLDADARISFYRNWAERPLHVEGTGHISIHDADLWHVPLLTSLGKILSVGTFRLFSRKNSARLGSISKLKATIECQGKRIFIPEIKTDGTVVALSGSGEYDLEEKQMDFLISGHFLKGLSIINWLLRPLSWAFKAELVGKPDDYQWHLRSGWRKLEDKDE